MGLMMILVAQLEGLDGVVSAEPSNYGIVLELEDRDALDDWLEDNPYALHDDVFDHEEALRKSNKSIPFGSPHDLRRLLREASDA